MLYILNQTNLIRINYESEGVVGKYACTKLTKQFCKTEKKKVQSTSTVTASLHVMSLVISSHFSSCYCTIDHRLISLIVLHITSL